MWWLLAIESSFCTALLVLERQAWLRLYRSILFSQLKALAHKLAIRFSHLYRNSYLIEINAQTLLSKYFSESGKLVSEVFGYETVASFFIQRRKIMELVQTKSTAIFLLIDEVESLTASRKNTLNTSEPGDAIR